MSGGFVLKEQPCIGLNASQNRPNVRSTPPLTHTELTFPPSELSARVIPKSLSSVYPVGSDFDSILYFLLPPAAQVRGKIDKCTLSNIVVDYS